MVTDVRPLVDAEKGLISRRIFIEDDIYQQELENIFARCWMFLCHESQVPNPGDFFATYMGGTRSWCGGTHRARSTLS